LSNGFMFGKVIE